MTQSRDWVEHLTQWRNSHALPLWTTLGLDAATQTVWESLNFDGTPRTDISRRIRVQFRQAYVFARQNDPEISALGWSIFRQAITNGFDPNSGLLSSWLSPQFYRLDQTHDLYDLAFGILAASALGKAGFDVAAEIRLLEKSLELLQAPIGWYEAADHRLPRRQNPHMHLFEASIALYDLTGEPLHRSWIQACLDLMVNNILSDSGSLPEFFSNDWTAYSGSEQHVEPGHLAEWIFLADAFEKSMGCSAGLPTDTFWAAIIESRLPSGFLPDRIGMKTRRLWPQIEFLKAALVREKEDTSLAQSGSIAKAIYDAYLSTKVNGGWFDQFTEDGKLLAKDIPASTLYHLEVAISAGLDTKSA